MDGAGYFDHALQAVTAELTHGKPDDPPVIQAATDGICTAHQYSNVSGRSWPPATRISR
jgi:hypothetical protein